MFLHCKTLQIISVEWSAHDGRFYSRVTTICEQFYERTVSPSIDYTKGTLIIKLHFNQKLHFRNHLRYHTSQKQPVDTLRIMY